MDVLGYNPSSKASVEFSLDHPFRFSRSGETFEEGRPVTFIYSRAVDGHNGICVAKVAIGLGVGLTGEQETALVDRITNEIVAPGFSDEEIEDIAYEFAICGGESGTSSEPYPITDAHRHHARAMCDNITARRRLNSSGVR